MQQYQNERNPFDDVNVPEQNPFDTISHVIIPQGFQVQNEKKKLRIAAIVILVIGSLAYASLDEQMYGNNRRANAEISSRYHVGDIEHVKAYSSYGGDLYISERLTQGVYGYRHVYISEPSQLSLNEVAAKVGIQKSVLKIPQGQSIPVRITSVRIDRWGRKSPSLDYKVDVDEFIREDAAIIDAARLGVVNRPYNPNAYAQPNYYAQSSYVGGGTTSYAQAYYQSTYPTNSVRRAISWKDQVGIASAYTKSKDRYAYLSNDDHDIIVFSSKDNANPLYKHHEDFTIKNVRWSYDDSVLAWDSESKDSVYHMRPVHAILWANHASTTPHSEMCAAWGFSSDGKLLVCEVGQMSAYEFRLLDIASNHYINMIGNGNFPIYKGSALSCVWGFDFSVQDRKYVCPAMDGSARLSVFQVNDGVATNAFKDGSYGDAAGTWHPMGIDAWTYGFYDQLRGKHLNRDIAQKTETNEY